MKNIFVLDQNFMRDDKLNDLIHGDNLKIVLPDTAFFEMCKAPEWKSTLKNSLEILAQKPHIVYLSAPSNEVIQWEENNRRPTSGIISRRYTQFARELLKEIAEAREGVAHAEIERLMYQRNENVNKRQEECKYAITNLKNKIGDSLSLEQQKKLRAKTIDDASLCQYIRELAPDCALSFFQSLGMNRERASFFCKKNPATIRRIYLNILNATEWIVSGGFEGLSPKKAENELIDQEYIIAGTYFDGILTKENDIKLLHRKLRLILRLPPSKDAPNQTPRISPTTYQPLL